MRYLTITIIALASLPSLPWAAPPAAAIEPSNAKETAQKKTDTDAATEEKYRRWRDGLPQDELRWVETLEQNLGAFYLPRYKSEKAAGRISAWDFVRDDAKLPRVLLIGDSVSRGYTLDVRRATAGKANIHRAPENCGPTANGIKKLGIWLGDGHWDLIHFNFGIHDRKAPAADYEKRLREIVARLRATKARLLWASSTPLPDSKEYSDADIVEKNAIASKVMSEAGVPTDDLYAFAKPHLAEWQNPGDCHFNAKGYEALGGRVAETILAHLTKSR
ncbi:MAG TPA: SGNH/GDSL hydrolase family protein [Verrucomicrobiae bacterium]|nr:SGNH/GDSL hydrolase family protein [Verrucomicrobiae bacterium]